VITDLLPSGFSFVSATHDTARFAASITVNFDLIKTVNMLNNFHRNILAQGKLE